MPTLTLFSVALRAGDREPLIDLNELMAVVYEAAALELAIPFGACSSAIDYHKAIVPGLSAEDDAWVTELID